MADIIQLLPDNIANQIAAGEVIQRPSSVVKELLENSIDANATHIQLIIKDAGKSLIQVIDNGKGMSFTDVRMSLERHATSKIKHIDDLFSIRTMGFRGEAMASIVAVAQVEIKTRLHTDKIGTCLLAEDSKIIQHELSQTPEGTSIAVKNLFFNVPARRNFLKSNPVETRHIIDEFTRIALAHPHIFFSFYHNGIQIYHLESGNLRQRITALFGEGYNHKLVPIADNTDIVSFSGFVSKPEFARKTRGEQFFFVNNRFIRSNYLHHAVMQAYGELLPRESYPLYVILLDIKPNFIDINVHPTKQEIKFEDDKLIYSYLSSSVKHALGKYNVMPSIDFDVQTDITNLKSFTHTVDKQAFEINNDSQIKKELKWDYKPDKASKNEVHAWRNAYDELQQQAQTINVQSAWNNTDVIENTFEKIESKYEKLPYQIHNKYIVNHIKSGILLIDQQSAHERILYERYCAQLENNKNQSQQSLFPSQFQLSTLDAVVLKSILHDVNGLGFNIEEFGNNSFIIHGVPADFANGNEQQIIQDFIEQFKLEKPSLQNERRNTIAKTFAKRNAIIHGKELSQNEMKSLIDELFACAMPYTSPTGKLTFITMELSDLEKQFGN